MSKDTTAFLAGFALSMVAVITLFKGGVTTSSGAQTGPPPQPSPYASVPPSPPSSQSSIDDYLEKLDNTNEGWVQRDWRLGQDLEHQQSVTNDLKSQIEKQQRDAEVLKQQLDQQQNETQKMIAQLQDQVRDQNRLINDLYARQQEQQVSSHLREAARDTTQRLEYDHRRLEEAHLPDPIAPQPLSSDELFDGIKTAVVWFAGAIAVVMIIGGVILVVMILIVLMLPARRPGQPKQPERQSVLPPPYYSTPVRRLMPTPPRSRYSEASSYPEPPRSSRYPEYYDEYPEYAEYSEHPGYPEYRG